MTATFPSRHRLLSADVISSKRFRHELLNAASRRFSKSPLRPLSADLRLPLVSTRVRGENVPSANPVLHAVSKRFFQPVDDSAVVENLAMNSAYGRVHVVLSAQHNIRATMFVV